MSAVAAAGAETYVTAAAMATVARRIMELKAAGEPTEYPPLTPGGRRMTRSEVDRLALTIERLEKGSKGGKKRATALGEKAV